MSGLHPFRSHHRRRLLATPMPPAWLDVIARDVPLVEALKGDERSGVLDTMRVLIDEKFWEAGGGGGGGGGFAVTDRVRVVIGAQIAFQMRHLDIDLLSQARTIIIYEGAYRQTQERVGRDGLVHTGSENLGEAWVNGPVILSWADALRSAQHPGSGRNVVFHEFAHVVDGAGGVLDGMPPLGDAELRGRWHAVMTEAFERVGENHRAGRGDVIRPYGLTNVAEFFAVTSELFFDAPQVLRQAHPDVFALFERWQLGR